MRGPSPEEIPVFLLEARRTLRLTQAELGRLLGMSKRTVIRMEQGRSIPAPRQYESLARALFPVNPSLAAHYAAAADTTLEALGLPAPPPLPTARTTHDRAATTHAMVDSIVCAAAEAMDVSPRAIRPALVSAIGRIRTLGLSLDEVSAALGIDAPPVLQTQGSND